MRGQFTRILKYTDLNVVSVTLILLSLLTSYYFEIFYGFTPCFLCILQRACFLVLLVFFGLRVFNFLTSPIYDLFSIIFILLGVSFSLRQVFLQNTFTSETTAFVCKPDLVENLNQLSLKEFFVGAFSGEGTCSEVTSTFLNLSFASWSLMIFSILLTFSLRTILVIKNNKS